MISAKNITKTYNGRVVLKNINISLKPLERVGLLGVNGAGKSTLLKILAGIEIPDEGKIQRDTDYISYAPQYPEFNNDTIEEYISNCNHSIVYQSLAQMGFEDTDPSFKCSLLSGGQQSKLILARALSVVPTPKVLLLDEPTNNLDIDGMDWLENYLRNYYGALLLTSHDRYFLDRICNKITLLEDGECTSYGGNYSFYKIQLAIKKEAYQKKYSAQNKMISKSISTISDLKSTAHKYESMFTSRHPFQKKKASKSARSAIVKEKKLEKFLNSVNILNEPENYQKYGIELKGDNPASKLILKVEDLSFSYNEKVIINHLSFNIYGQDRLWIRGKNGSGKTTLLNILYENSKLNSLFIKYGLNIKVGYLSQNYTTLEKESTGIDELSKVCNLKNLCYQMASHLQLFEDDINKSVLQLSTGQKMKLEFAKLLLSNNNLIILDEPTNHLEIETREDIEKALSLYKGAIIVSSHDRYFIEKLEITKSLELTKN